MKETGAVTAHRKTMDSKVVMDSSVGVEEDLDNREMKVMDNKDTSKEDMEWDTRVNMDSTTGAGDSRVVTDNKAITDNTWAMKVMASREAMDNKEVTVSREGMGNMEAMPVSKVVLVAMAVTARADSENNKAGMEGMEATAAMARATRVSTDNTTVVTWDNRADMEICMKDAIMTRMIIMKEIMVPACRGVTGVMKKTMTTMITMIMACRAAMEKKRKTKIMTRMRMKMGMKVAGSIKCRNTHAAGLAACHAKENVIWQGWVANTTSNMTRIGKAVMTVCTAVMKKGRTITKAVRAAAGLVLPDAVLPVCQKRKYAA